jgi:hypothetical protein
MLRPAGFPEPDSNRRRGDHDPECLPLHHGDDLHGDGRTRTGGLSPDKRALCPSELRPPLSRAGGIRTDGLELMRLRRQPLLYRAQVWLAGVEPAVSGFQCRRGGQLPNSQMTTVETRTRSVVLLVGGPGLLPRLSLSGPEVLPLPRGRPAGTRRSSSAPGGTRTRSLRVEGPASSPLRPRGRATLRRQGSNLRSRG